MGFFSTCGRIFLVVVNLIFLLIGLIIFTLGFFCIFGDSVLSTYYQPTLDSLSESLSSSGFGTVDLSSFNIKDLLGSLGIGFIISGLFISIICILGFIGGCCKVRILLFAYVGAVIIVIIAQVILIGVLYGSDSTIKDPAKNTLKEKIQSDYQGINGTNVVSLSMNLVNIQVKCCGIDSYSDFTGATLWTTNYPSYTLITPLSCCMTLPSSTDYSCASAPSNSNNYWKTSCFDEIWDMTIGNTLVIGLAIGGLALFQVIMIIFAILLICDGKKNKVDSAHYKKNRNH